MLWLLVLSLVGLVAGNSWADPRTWDLNGVSVRQAYDVTWTGQTAMSDDGSVILIWTDARNGSRELYGQLLSPSGEPQWGLNGRLLAHTEGIGIYWPVIAYSSDGWVVLWQDADLYNTSEEVVIHGRMKAMKYSSDGSAMWNDLNQTGITLYNEQSHSLQENVLWVRDDGDGGAYCCWINETYFYAQRVAGDGTAAWASPLETAHNGNGWGYALDASSDGGLLIGWKQHPAQYEIRCNKINAAGNNAWAVPALLCQQAAYLANIRLVADEHGGAMFFWFDERISEIPDIYSRNVDEAGHPVGSVNGHFLFTPNSVKHDFKTTRSINNGAMDGVLFSWREELDGYSLGYTQKCDLNGNIRWGEFPIPLCTRVLPDASQENISLITDNAGRGLCCWTEMNGIASSSIVRVALFDSAEVVWTDSAITVRQGFNFGAVQAAVTGDNSFITIWKEMRNPSGAIFLQSHDLTDGSGNFTDALGLDHLIDGECSHEDVLPLPGGKSVIVWQDTRTQGNQLYFQVLEADGSIELERDGAQLVEVDAQGFPELDYPLLCDDGNGGFFAAFSDNTNAPRVFRATHWNSEGEQVGPATGAIVSDSLIDAGLYSQIVPDGNGGAFVACENYDALMILDVLVSRIDDECRPVWDSPYWIPTEAHDMFLVGLAPSDSGSCIVVTRRGIYPTYHAQATKVSADGEALWALDVTLPDSNAEWITVTSDLQDGAVLSYAYHETGHAPNIYVQRVTADGSLVWNENGEGGLAVTATDYFEYAPSIAVDDLGNIIVAWRQMLTDGVRIIAQKVSATGDLLWPAEGIELDQVAYYGNVGRIVALNHENLYFTWTAWPNENGPVELLHATHLNADGERAEDPFWNMADAAVICDSAWAITSESVVTDDDAVVIVWQDWRSRDRVSSLYMQRIHDPSPTFANENPTIPTEFSLEQNYPNPFNPETVLEFSLPTASRATLKVFDVTGRLVGTLMDEPMTAGSHRVQFDAARLPSGVYFYTLRADHRSLTQKMVLLK